MKNLFRKTVFRDNYKLAIGTDFYIKVVDYSGVKAKIIAYDLFYEKFGLKELHSTFFGGSLGALYVIDDTSEVPFRDLDEWLPILQYEVGKDLKGYAFLLVRNIKSKEESTQLKNLIAEKSKWFNGYIECDFTTEEHVEMIFQEIITLIIENSRRETPFGLRKQGLTYLFKKQYAKAIECYKKALELNPEYEIVKKELDQVEKQIL